VRKIFWGIVFRVCSKPHSLPLLPTPATTICGGEETTIFRGQKTALTYASRFHFLLLKHVIQSWAYSGDVFVCLEQLRLHEGKQGLHNFSTAVAFSVVVACSDASSRILYAISLFVIYFVHYKL